MKVEIWTTDKSVHLKIPHKEFRCDMPGLMLEDEKIIAQHMVISAAFEYCFPGRELEMIDWRAQQMRAENFDLATLTPIPTDEFKLQQLRAK